MTMMVALKTAAMIMMVFSFLTFIGDHCLLTGYSGNFQPSRLTEAKDIIMIAGGTGLC